MRIDIQLVSVFILFIYLLLFFFFGWAKSRCYIIIVWEIKIKSWRSCGAGGFFVVLIDCRILYPYIYIHMRFSTYIDEVSVLDDCIYGWY